MDAFELGEVNPIILTQSRVPTAQSEALGNVGTARFEIRQNEFFLQHLPQGSARQAMCQVLYHAVLFSRCHSRCQKADWKAHRKVCGKQRDSTTDGRFRSQVDLNESSVLNRPSTWRRETSRYRMPMQFPAQKHGMSSPAPQERFNCKVDSDETCS